MHTVIFMRYFPPFPIRPPGRRSIAEAPCGCGHWRPPFGRRPPAASTGGYKATRCRFLAEQGKVLLGEVMAAAHPQQQVGEGRIGGGIALRGVEPIDDVGLSRFGADDDLGRDEVAVADLVIFGDALQPGIEIVAVGGAERRVIDAPL